MTRIEKSLAKKLRNRDIRKMSDFNACGWAVYEVYGRLRAVTQVDYIWDGYAANILRIQYKTI